MKARTKVTQLAAVMIATAAAVVCSGGASAAPSTAPTTTAIITPMVLVGYDAEVAKANGFQIVTRPDGTQASVPVTAAGAALALSRAGSVPLGAPVAGNCGTSRVYIQDAGGAKAAVGTGWTTIKPSIAYGWSVTVAGGGTTYTKSFSGGLLNRTSWTGSFSWTVPKSDYYVAAVSPANSYAVLNDGGICVSLGPTDGEWVYR